MALGAATSRGTWAGAGASPGPSAEGLCSLQPRVWGSPSPGILEVCHAPGISCSPAGCGDVRIRGRMAPAEHSPLAQLLEGTQLHHHRHPWCPSLQPSC